MLRETMLNDTTTCEEDRSRLTTFAASVGWVDKFVRRHALRSVSMHGEAASANAAKVAQNMVTLRQALKEFDLDCIFNMDETGLFYKLLPRRTYICDFEDRKSVRGTKAMRAKDRITAYVCTNATGQKVPMSIIGTAKNPRCFRVERPPVHYSHQRNS